MPDQGQKPRPAAYHPPRHNAMLARSGFASAFSNSARLLRRLVGMSQRIA
jgi:hypothetical protein